MGGLRGNGERGEGLEVEVIRNERCGIEWFVVRSGACRLRRLLLQLFLLPLPLHCSFLQYIKHFKSPYINISYSAEVSHVTSM